MSVHVTANVTHNATVVIAESAFQVSETAATTQPNMNAATITFYRKCAQSAVANGLSPSAFMMKLQTFGQGLYA